MCQLTAEAVKNNPEVVLYNTVADFPSDRWFDSGAVLRSLSARGVSDISIDSVSCTLDALVREGMVNKEFGFYRNIA